MKKQILILQFIIGSLVFVSCKKDKENNNLDNNNVLPSKTLSDDQLELQGEIFAFKTGYSICATVNGHYTHQRDVLRPNTTQNQPSFLISLGKLPDPGQTSTFTLDDGFWATYPYSPECANKAYMKIQNYFDEANQQEQNWFSDSLSGTVSVSVSSDGKPTFNFSNIKLIHIYTSMDKRKTVSGKNLICH